MRSVGKYSLLHYQSRAGATLNSNLCMESINKELFRTSDLLQMRAFVAPSQVFSGSSLHHGFSGKRCNAHRALKLSPSISHCVRASRLLVIASDSTARGTRRPRLPIKLMACDIDGTILNSKSKISNPNIAAVIELLEKTEVMFVPATGKSRASAIRSLAGVGERLKSIYPKGCPGVFLQGLVVFGKEGQVVYENKCNVHLARLVTELSAELQVSLFACSRDSIVCEKRDEYLDLLPGYHEPEATEMGEWDKALAEVPLNKFVFMGHPDRIKEIRPIVSERIGNMGCLTQAQSNMLEVLPPNSSKGDGVRRLLREVNISPDNVLAIGDAENDIELLQMVGYSCAVGNAIPSVKEVAEFTDLPTNNEHGVAHAINRFIMSSVI